MIGSLIVLFFHSYYSNQSQFTKLTESQEEREEAKKRKEKQNFFNMPSTWKVREMGGSKRITEIIRQERNGHKTTTFP
jgi:hypothetical protein